MDKKIFNPLDWLEQPGQQKINTDTPEVKTNTDAYITFKTVQVEEQFIGDWVKFLTINLDPETTIRNNAPV